MFARSSKSSVSLIPSFLSKLQSSSSSSSSCVGFGRGGSMRRTSLASWREKGLVTSSTTSSTPKSQEPYLHEDMIMGMWKSLGDRWRWQPTFTLCSPIRWKSESDGSIPIPQKKGRMQGRRQTLTSPFLGTPPRRSWNNCGGGEEGEGHSEQCSGGSGSSPSQIFLKMSASGFSLGFLGLFENKEKLSPEDELLLKIKRGILAIQEHDFPKAERHLADAWKMCEELDRDDVRTQIMDIQANLALEKGEFDRASRLFQLVVQRMVYHNGVKPTDNAVVEISMKLAQIYALQGKNEEALAGWKWCIDTQREKIAKGEKDEDTLMLAGWSLHILAQVYMAIGGNDNIAAASVLAKEALSCVSDAVGPDAEQSVTIRSDLASILGLQGEVDEALTKLEECERIAAEKFQQLHAAIRVNTGSLYLQKGDYSEAEKICRQAKAMAGKYRDLETALRADECITKSGLLLKDEAKNHNNSHNKTAKSS